MLWIGLTGSIGTGKSTIARWLKESGYDVVDSDELAHECFRKNSDCFNKVIKLFGQAIVGENGEIDRKQLANLVFTDRSRLELLESVVHPFVVDKINLIKQSLIRSNCQVAFCDMPLLYEKSLQSQFDSVVIVYCTERQQLERIQLRDRIPEREVQQRMENQISIEDKKKLANIVIDNSGSLEKLREEFEKFKKGLPPPG